MFWTDHIHQNAKKLFNLMVIPVCQSLCGVDLFLEYFIFFIYFLLIFLIYFVNRHMTKMITLSHLFWGIIIM